MKMSNRARSAFIVCGVVALIGATSGITYAATTLTSAQHSAYASACVNGNHTLRLTNSKGSCPSGYSSFKVASAPTSLALNGSGSPANSQKVTAGNFTFVGKCFEDIGGFTHAQLAVSSSTQYDFQGTYYYFSGGGSPSYTSPVGDTLPGAGQISFAATTHLTSAFRLGESGGVTGNALIISSGHTIAVTFAIFAYPGNCSVQAQLTPSG